MAIYKGTTKVAGGVAPMITLTKAQYDALSSLQRAGNIYMVIDEFEANIFNLMYPVGSIYMTVNSANPSTLFGGTWAAWGSGRVPVGMDTGTFNTIEKLGGAENHTLDVTQIPSHRHTLRRDVSGVEMGIAGGAATGNALAGTFTNTAIYPSSITPEFIGGGLPHNNMPPYITCYMWKRTA